LFFFVVLCVGGGGGGGGWLAVGLSHRCMSSLPPSLSIWFPLSMFGHALPLCEGALMSGGEGGSLKRVCCVTGEERGPFQETLNMYNACLVRDAGGLGTDWGR